MSRSITIHRRGFTLIELLVVISIIALMVSLLLPALRSARETARTVQCASQIRQVMVGLLMYTDDYGGNLPFSWEERAGPDQYWPGLIGSSTFGYLPSPQTFWCSSRDVGWWKPEVENMLSDRYDGHWAYTGYSASRYGAMPQVRDIAMWGYHPLNVARPLPASGIMVLVEGYHPANYALGRDGYYFVNNGFSTSALFSHDKISNAAFLDGHAESLQDEALGWSAERKMWHTAMGIVYDRSVRPWFTGIHVSK